MHSIAMLPWFRRDVALQIAGQGNGSAMSRRGGEGREGSAAPPASSYSVVMETTGDVTTLACDVTGCVVLCAVAVPAASGRQRQAAAEVTAADRS